jgi:hypothetical protein
VLLLLRLLLLLCLLLSVARVKLAGHWHRGQTAYNLL